MSQPPPRTQWSLIVIAITAGITIAFQVGKVPAALPPLEHDLGIGLTGKGAIVSLFSALTALSGLLIGRFADRIGHYRAVIIGMSSAITSGLAGAFATAPLHLFVTRIGEGLGFILVVVSMPPLIAAAAAAHDRQVALGIWGAFMPAGMSMMLLASPALIALAGWRGLWVVTSGLIAIMAIGFLISFRANPAGRPQTGAPEPLLDAVARPGPLLLAGCFGAYAAQFIAVSSFLPTLLIEEQGVTAAHAATIGALVVAVNIAGNVMAGWFLRWGVRQRHLLMATAAIMGLSTSVMFLEIFPLPVRIAAAFSFSAFGGLIPGALFARAPDYAAHPGQLARIVGVMIQGSGIGQLIGPLMLTTVVGAFGGWPAAPLFTLPAAAICIAFAWALPSR